MNSDQRNESYELEERIRKNIAYELHDSVGQQLSSIKFFVEALARSSDVPSGSNVEKCLKEIVKMIQHAGDEVRRVALELRPKILDDLGLVPTIEWLLKEYKKAHPEVFVDKCLDVDELAITDKLKVTIFRILQECLNNIAKHAGATEILVSLKQRDRGLELLVRDNGIGFDCLQLSEADNYNSGLGLSSIKCRVELTGGHAVVDSVKGDGTKIHVIWKNE